MTGRVLGVVLLLAALAAGQERAPLPELVWAFASAETAWRLDHDLEETGRDPGGWRLRATGDDPYLSSPEFLLRSETGFEIEIVWTVAASSDAQVFWTEGNGVFDEARSVRLRLPRGRRTVTRCALVGAEGEARVLSRLRLDPGTAAGGVTLERVSLRARSRLRLRNEGEALVLDLALAIPAGEAPAKVELRPDRDLLPLGEEAVVAAAGTLLRTTRRFRPRRPGLRVIEVAWAGRLERLHALVPGRSLPEPRRAPGPETRLRPWREGLGFDLEAGGRLLARVTMPELVLSGSGGPASLDPTSAETTLKSGSRGPVLEARLEAFEGAEITLSMEIESGSPGVFGLTSRLESAAPLGLLHWVPAALVHVADGDHDQALLAGIEFLGAGEDSSSRRDHRTPDHLRTLPHPLDSTLPLASILHEGRWCSLDWAEPDAFSPLFSVPDRELGLGGSAAAIVHPAVGRGRLENARLAHEPAPLRSGVALVARATISCGSGEDLAPAIEAFVRRVGLPPRPSRPRGATGDRRLLAAALLGPDLFDPLTRGFAHCAEPHWPRGPCADLPALMLRLADSLERRPLADVLPEDGVAVEPLFRDDLAAQQLRERAQSVADRLPPEARLGAFRAHGRTRLWAFLEGPLAPALEALAPGPDELDPLRRSRRLRLEGDLAATHFEDTALGLHAQLAVEILERARLTGDPRLRAAGRELLEGMRRFDLGVPRGAQTWEVPLHTPDILASALAVRALVSGLELDPRPDDLERARRHAWKGMPFVYLRARPDLECMAYATIAVLGATHYVAPDWIGLPVQWCGLEYARSLFDLARHDPEGPWRRVGEGIVLAALQMLVPEGFARGCLPDSFVLETQERRGPMINPGGLLPLVLELDGEPPPLEWAGEAAGPSLVGSAGIRVVRSDDEGFAAELSPHLGVARLVLAPIRRPGAVIFEGEPLPERPDEDPRPGWCHQPSSGRLLLRIAGRGRVEVLPRARPGGDARGRGEEGG